MITSLYRDKVHSVPNHAKVMIVDDEVAYIGSQNLYATAPGNLTEFGLIISDKDKVKELVDQYWTQMWSNSWENRTYVEMSWKNAVEIKAPQFTKNQVATAVFKNKMYMAYVDAQSRGDENNYIWITSGDDETGEVWEVPHIIEGHYTKVAPSLMGFEDKLFMAYKVSSDPKK